jgi:hypothetical protein
MNLENAQSCSQSTIFLEVMITSSLAVCSETSPAEWPGDHAVFRGMANGLAFGLPAVAFDQDGPGRRAATFACAMVLSC